MIDQYIGTNRTSVIETLVRTLLAFPTTMATPNYLLFAMGNPLLDMQVKNGEELLKKYDLKANDAILAEEKQMPM